MTFQQKRDEWAARNGFQRGTFDDCTTWEDVEAKKNKLVEATKAALQSSIGFDQVSMKSVEMSDIVRRKEHALPSSPGYYYGRIINSSGGGIVPCKIAWGKDRRYLLVIGAHRDFHVKQFQWFGPVPVCEEVK